MNTKDLYLVYITIPAKMFSSRIKFLIPRCFNYQRFKDQKDGKNYLRGLYGWTFSKSIINEFKELRSDLNIYIIKKTEIDKDTENYRDFIYEYGDIELKRFKYSTNKKEFVELVTTKNEYYVSVTEKDMYMEDLGPKAVVDYSLFNDELIEALDVLGYTTRFDSAFCDNLYKVQEAKENRRNGLTVFGNKYYDISNELGSLLYLFHYMFCGDIADAIDEDAYHE